MVAAYHSLVGLAAVTTAIASYMAHGDAPSADIVHRASEYLGTLIGAVTLTGSAVAFGKLQGVMDSKPLALPGKNVRCSVRHRIQL